MYGGTFLLLLSGKGASASGIFTGTYIPQSSLNTGTTYVATVSGVSDIYGNTLSTFSWNFTTVGNSYNVTSSLLETSSLLSDYSLQRQVNTSLQEVANLSIDYAVIGLNSFNANFTEVSSLIANTNVINIVPIDLRIYNFNQYDNVGYFSSDYFSIGNSPVFINLQSFTVSLISDVNLTINIIDLMSPVVQFIEVADFENTTNKLFSTNVSFSEIVNLFANVNLSFAIQTSLALSEVSTLLANAEFFFSPDVLLFQENSNILSYTNVLTSPLVQLTSEADLQPLFTSIYTVSSNLSESSNFFAFVKVGLPQRVIQVINFVLH